MPSRSKIQQQKKQRLVRNGMISFVLISLFIGATLLVRSVINQRSYSEADASSSMATITIPPTNQRKTISKYIWGVNYEGFNPYSELGTDSSRSQSAVYANISRAKLNELGATIVRFPGGWPAYFYNYKTETLSYNNGNSESNCRSGTSVNNPFLSIAEMRTLAGNMGAEVLYQVNAGLPNELKCRVHNGYPNYNGSVADARDIAQTHTRGSNPITYFQIANEENFIYDRPGDHINRAREYARAIKEANPNVKVILNGGFANYVTDWVGATKGIVGRAGGGNGCGPNNSLPCFDLIGHHYMSDFARFNSEYGAGNYAVTEWNQKSECWKSRNPLADGTNGGIATLRRIFSMVEHDVTMANYHDLAVNRDSCSLFANKTTFSPRGHAFSFSSKLAGTVKTLNTNNSLPRDVSVYSSLVRRGNQDILQVMLANGSTSPQVNLSIEVNGMYLTENGKTVRMLKQQDTNFAEARATEFPKYIFVNPLQFEVSALPAQSMTHMEIVLTDVVQLPEPGIGFGLSGSYSNIIPGVTKIVGAQNPMPSTVRKVDPSVNFNWKTRPVVDGLVAGDVYVEWNGALALSKPGTYRFQIQTNQGAELLINDTRIFRRWGTSTRVSGKRDGKFVYTLPAGKTAADLTYDDYPKVTLRVFDTKGPVVAKLRWIEPGTKGWKVVPISVFRHRISNVETQPTPNPTATPQSTPGSTPTVTSTPSPTTPGGTTPSLIQAESMSISGPYAGLHTNGAFGTTQRENGVGFFANGDQASTTTNFPVVPGTYTFSIRGYSSNGQAAGMSLFVGGTKVGAVTFTSTTPSIQRISGINIAAPSSKEVRLLLETDTGANDTYIDWVEYTRN